MKLLILAGGRPAASAPEAQLAADYLKRLGPLARRIGLTETRLIEIDERKARDAAAWLDPLPKAARLVALDERGEDLASTELAKRLQAWAASGAPALAFAIGAADGLPAEVKARADATLAFGRATWPHLWSARCSPSSSTAR